MVDGKSGMSAACLPHSAAVACDAETMGAISQSISEGSELLSARACWLDTQQNEAEWRQVAELDDNENSCDKDVMDAGSRYKNIHE